MTVSRTRLKTHDVRVVANGALNVLTLGGMDRTFNIPRHIPKEVVIGVIRSGRLGLTCKNTRGIWKMPTESSSFNTSGEGVCGG